ncbi:ANTAR domain-containing protein [Streptomyces sp. NPDC102467]|uniref:ANTAR domain-containing protein n=1 Tax=Streptomyces sp. NPDC102467 TaxID=3366179 RepID=UPI00382ED5C5
MTRVSQQTAAEKPAKTNTDTEVEARVAALEREVAQLRQAVDAHGDVGQAIGVIVTVAHVPPARAWEVLREVSQRTNTRVRQVAGLLTAWAYTGVLPDEVRTEFYRRLQLCRAESSAEAGEASD